MFKHNSPWEGATKEPHFRVPPHLLVPGAHGGHATGTAWLPSDLGVTSWWWLGAKAQALHPPTHIGSCLPTPLNILPGRG